MVRREYDRRWIATALAIAAGIADDRNRATQVAIRRREVAITAGGTMLFAEHAEAVLEAVKARIDEYPTADDGSSQG
jgi:hypothetical protein